ncbi:MAG: phosphoribosylglycinamide formyltransferase [Candidatus Dormibacteria bacterium]
MTSAEAGSGGRKAPLRLGILVSGVGSNLAAILESIVTGDLDAEVACVASNRASSAALEVARSAGVEQVGVFSLGEHQGQVRLRDAAIADAFEAAGVELVVTAGYDRVLDEAFVARFATRIINLHPSLLPAFGGGMDAIEQALRAGVKVTGVTVHLIEPGTLDTGAIVAQEAVTVEDGDSLETLSRRVHAAEHRLLPRVIQWWSEGRVQRTPDRVVIRNIPQENR